MTKKESGKCPNKKWKKIKLKKKTYKINLLVGFMKKIWFNKVWWVHHNLHGIFIYFDIKIEYELNDRKVALTFVNICSIRERWYEPGTQSMMVASFLFLPSIHLAISMLSINCSSLSWLPNYKVKMITIACSTEYRHSAVSVPWWSFRANISRMLRSVSFSTARSRWRSKGIFSVIILINLLSVGGYPMHNLYNIVMSKSTIYYWGCQSENVSKSTRVFFCSIRFLFSASGALHLFCFIKILLFTQQVNHQ